MAVKMPDKEGFDKILVKYGTYGDLYSVDDRPSSLLTAISTPIKLFIDHNLDSSGKGKFLTRLVPELEKLGVKITNYKDSNVVLGVNKYRTGVSKDKHRTIKDKKKRILRVDGIHLLNTKRNRWANRVVKEDGMRSDAIIWQTKFCRDMWYGIMKMKCKREYVIFNGAEKINDRLPVITSCTQNVLMCAKWLKGRDNKRLPEMLQIADEYTKINKDVCFWVAGEYFIKPPKNDRIVMLGRIEERELQRYILMCNCMLFLAHYDWCPNSVVEAEVRGCPVIASNNSGVAEIASIILDLDKPIKPKMMKKYKPPPVDHKKVFEAINNALVIPDTLINILQKEELLIENTAKQYFKVFKDVLCSKRK